MRIISKAAITGFCKSRKDALEPLLYWYRIAKRARWQNLMQVRADFLHADAAGPFTVFNIAGNKYRLIVVMKYQWQVIYVRHIVTHSEYSKEKWKS